MKYETVDPETGEELSIETQTRNKYKTVITRYRTGARAGKVKQVEDFFDGRLVRVLGNTYDAQGKLINATSQSR